MCVCVFTQYFWQSFQSILCLRFRLHLQSNKSFGAVALGTVSLGAAALGAVSFGAAALGAVALGAVSLGVVALGAVALGAVGLGDIYNEVLGPHVALLWLGCLK